MECHLARQLCGCWACLSSESSFADYKSPERFPVWVPGHHRSLSVSHMVRIFNNHSLCSAKYCHTAIDFIYKGFKANEANRDHIFWNETISSAQGSSQIDHPMTSELSAGISTRIIFTKDPENIKAILTGQFQDYGKGESFHREWKEFLGDSIFATDGELWSRSRQLIRPMFARDRIVDTEIFEKHVQTLIPMLSGTHAAPGGSKAVDVGSLFFRYALDAATDYLFGVSTGSLEHPTTTFAEAFRYVQHRQTEFTRAG